MGQLSWFLLKFIFSVTAFISVAIFWINPMEASFLKLVYYILNAYLTGRIANLGARLITRYKKQVKLNLYVILKVFLESCLYGVSTYIGVMGMMMNSTNIPGVIDPFRFIIVAIAIKIVILSVSVAVSRNATHKLEQYISG